MNDDEENIRRTGSFAASLPHLEGVSLLPYHDSAVHKYASLNRPYQMGDVELLADERMGALAEILRGYGLEVKIGG
jgi:pyruvate formate lyase activating enzyme